MSEFSFMQPDKSSSHMQSKTAYKGNETDPTNASANVLADTPPTCWPTHHRRVGRHITNASAELKGKIASNQNTKRKSIDDAIFNCDTRT